MAKNFYNLPPPWNPGYAIPKSVMDEGLQRHAYVTKMMPRGTYDNTKVGAAGYAIPQYVMEEGTGRGTFTTAWLPRGYYGPDLPHYQNRHPVPPIPMSGLGDIQEYSTLPGMKVAQGTKALQRYGQNSAAAVLSSVSRMPASARPGALHQIMKRIDPTLPARAQAETAKAARRGVPAHKALQVGLANAMTTGMLAELSKIGRTRVVPQSTSLLGLGVYQELGAVTGVAAKFASALTSSIPTLKSKTIDVGGLSFPTDPSRNWAIPISDPGQISPALRAVVGPAMRRGVGAAGPKIPWVYTWTDWVTAPGGMEPKGKRTMASFRFRQPGEVWKGDRCYWFEALGIKCTQFDWSHAQVNPNGGPFGQTQISNGDTFEGAMLAPWGQSLNWNQLTGEGGSVAPVARFKHPINGDDWGLFFSINPSGVVTDPSAVSYAWISRIPGKPWWAKLGSIINYIPSKIVDAEEVALNAGADVGAALGNEACKLLQTPGAAQGAAVASGGAAGLGVGVAASLCGPGAQPPPPPPPQMPSIMMPLLIGGGALLLISVLKKKKPQP